MSGSRALLCAVGSVAALAGCAARPYEILLMPAPDVYDDGTVDPFAGRSAGPVTSAEGVFYATDRTPAEAGDSDAWYTSERSDVLRLGVARVELAHGELGWEEARRISLMKERPGRYPLSVAGVEELGVLDRSLTALSPEAAAPEDPGPAARFAERIDRRLDASPVKDVYVFVHGFRVIFEDPLLVAAELWHFLGYQGAFVAYAWPSTPHLWAYMGDAETAAGYARHLRIFLEYLADETQAERIHVVGHSAGTRLVARALEQMALVGQKDPDAERARLRLGNVLLVASDVDRQVFGSYVSDGALEVMDHLTIYVSRHDDALWAVRLLSSRERLGQMWVDEGMRPRVAEAIESWHDDLSVVDVTGAEGATSGDGHSYFMRSPWVSSDVLMTLLYDLRPAERGLVRGEEPVWTFPEDYIERLRASLAERAAASGD